MDEIDKSDLIGFAIASAIVSLQQADEISAKLSEDIVGMLNIMKDDYDPKTAAALCWAASKAAPFKASVDWRYGDLAREPNHYWEQFESEFNEITLNLSAPYPDRDNVVDFMAYYRRARK